MIPPAITQRLNLLTVAHALGLIVSASWIFGGNIWWMRNILAIWSLAGGIFLTACLLLQPGKPGKSARGKAWCLIPLGVFNVIVVASCFNRGFFPTTIEGVPLLVHFGERFKGWPSTAVPLNSLRELALFTGAYLSAFNLMCSVFQRSQIRLLFMIIAGNALLLAIFGTLQKLAGAGLYFGASQSSNARFFASFIYYNHWGAFATLCLGPALGLVFYYIARHRSRDLWHSPFTLWVLGAGLIAASAPISASRAATGMAALLGLIAIFHGIRHIIVSRKRERRSAALPVAAVILALGLTLTAVTWLASQSIRQRYQDTVVTLHSDQSFFSGRAALYRDTLNLALEKPVFGWGLESYGTAFLLVRPVPIDAHNRNAASYFEAHSDWLQLFMETGAVGCVLFLAMFLLPCLGLRPSALREPLIAYPLLGCGLVAVYAWIELPFSNAAVMLTSLALFFLAIRHAQLDAEDVRRSR